MRSDSSKNRIQFVVAIYVGIAQVVRFVEAKTGKA